MEVKGTAVVVFNKFVARRFGPTDLMRCLEALPAGSRAIMEGRVDVNKWYPLQEAYLVPTETLCRIFYDGDPRGAWELGRDSADYALSGIYSSLVKLTTVKLYVQRGSIMLPNYYRPCRSQTDLIEDGRAVIRLTEFPESHPLVEQRISGWMQRALEVRGCRDVKVVTPRAMSRGDRDTEFVITWE